MVTLATAHPAKFPAAVEAATGVRPALPAGLADITGKRGALRHARQRHRRRSRITLRREHAQQRRKSESMTVRLSRLESGLTVVTHAMDHLESAALGVWVGAGSRSEREHEHGLSHLLEHMAFKGTQRARPSISPSRSRRSAARSTPRPASRPRPTTPACSRTTCRSPSISFQRHPAEFGLRSERTRPRAACHPAGDRRGARHARRPRLRPVHRSRLSRPSRSAAPSSARRRRSAPSARRCSTTISTGTIAGRRWCSRRPARSTTTGSSSWPRSASATSPASRADSRPRRATPAASCASRATCMETQVMIGFEGRPYTSDDLLHRASPVGRPRRRHVLAALPGSARAARPLLLDLRLPLELLRHRHVRRPCRDRARRRRRTDAGDPRRTGAMPPTTSTRSSSTAPRRSCAPGC